MALRKIKARLPGKRLRQLRRRKKMSNLASVQSDPHNVFDSPDPSKTITYSNDIKSRPKRIFVRTVELMTGSKTLVSLAQNYQDDLSDDVNFWNMALNRLQVGLDIQGEGKEGLISGGPTVFVANHPYGILDGLSFGRLLSMVRNDYMILTNSVLCQIPEVSNHLLPISFEEGRRGIETNLKSRKIALENLENGGAVGVFPGGTVSTSARIRGRAIDPEWKNFTAKMITKSNAQVVPLYFEGENSRLFQMASHLSLTLRLSLYLNEVKKKIGTNIKVIVGKPILAERLAAYRSNPTEMMEMLRRETYSLSGEPIRKRQYGWPHRPAQLLSGKTGANEVRY